MRNLENNGPGKRLPALAPGLASLPPSKSQVLRALMIAATSQRGVSLSYEHGAGWGEAGEDILRGLDCARALGADVSVNGGAIEVHPRGEEPSLGRLNVGESGFLGRVAPTCAALCRSGRWLVHSSGSLRARSSQALWSALRGAGVDVTGDSGWPTEVHCVGDRGELHLDGPTSSQELSALLIALASSGGGEVLVSGPIPSAPYLALTSRLLGSFGAVVGILPNGFEVSPVVHAPEVVIEAEVDASAAAVALAAGCISGVRVEVPAPCPESAQGDWRVVEHLRYFGCVIEEEGGCLIAAGGPKGGAELDLSGEPDLAPALVAVAAHAALVSGEGSAFAGLHTLDGKESRRGQVLCKGFSEVGFDCDWRDPVLTIGSGKPHSSGLVLDSHEDHRMGFAFALLGLSIPSVSVGGPDCTAKSWPNFWSSMA